MRDFIFKMPAKVRFGIGLSKELGTILKQELGAKKVFVATDGGIVKAGIIGKIGEGLKAGNLDYCIYDQLVPDPTIEIVDQAAEVLKKKRCGRSAGGWRRKPHRYG